MLHTYISRDFCERKSLGNAAVTIFVVTCCFFLGSDISAPSEQRFQVLSNVHFNQMFL